MIDALLAQDAFFSQRFQHAASGTVAQRRVAPAADKLEYLRDEFDFTDAAAPQFDVVAALRMTGFLANHFSPDLTVHITHSIYRAEIQIAAIHERPNDAFQ